MLIRMIQLGLACLILVACAGVPFTWENARKVELGMSADQVTELMGNPYSVTTRGGEVIWVYTWVNLASGTKTVSYIFKDGAVISVPTIPDGF
ncbi:outer membrane protein assembly factor BamE [Spongiibacter sp. KMU-166]|uniref:Outer membrane protein assembly factor BamE n=1 Tax=Spongiibacter thalassae TaxID=2721624 RepID=A0ABX1GKI0_9GAMM|nr:outer membrane protein assembly factor BamE [Spongiibacter thalassae]